MRGLCVRCVAERTSAASAPAGAVRGAAVPAGAVRGAMTRLTSIDVLAGTIVASSVYSVGAAGAHG